jgi:hypothetical protein
VSALRMGDRAQGVAIPKPTGLPTTMFLCEF